MRSSASWTDDAARSAGGAVALTALERWREQLEAWRIPTPILEAAPEPPWGYPTELFRHRAHRVATEPDAPTASPTTRRAAEALPDGGSVLDVGCGGGATSLALADRIGTLVGVDGQPDMLQGFVEQAAAVGVVARGVHGAWPQIATEVETVDVVVCGHVLYNVPDVGPFVAELTRHARIRIVIEVTDRHPLSWMAHLWTRFHGIDRPDGPTADDAVAAIAETGQHVRREDHVDRHGPGTGFVRREDAVALVRRRLCLPAERDPEIEAALGGDLRHDDGLWSAGAHDERLVTLWWDVTSDAGPTTAP